MPKEVKQENPWAGKLFLCLIGLMVLAAGGIFEWLMLRSYLNAKETRTWPQAQATIIFSEVEQRQYQGSPKEYRLLLAYSYVFQGKEYSSDRFSPRGSKWTRKQEKVEGLAKEYPKDSSHTVWIDPGKPDQAILKHDTKAAGYTLWFPTLFIIGGLGMIFGAFKRSG